VKFIDALEVMEKCLKQANWMLRS